MLLLTQCVRIYLAQKWAGEDGNVAAAQDILVALAKVRRPSYNRIKTPTEGNNLVRMQSLPLGGLSVAHTILQANSEAQLGKFTGPHPVPGGGRILQALRFGGAGK